MRKDSFEKILPEVNSVEKLVLKNRDTIKEDEKETSTVQTKDVVLASQGTEKKINKENWETLTERETDTDESYRPDISPCTTPMGYKLGTFDARFSLSKEDFLAITKDAIKTWENAAGKSLFVYDERGTLTLNLIYDERQARTIDLGYLALEIENTKQANLS